jgi:hypothetical protein
MTINKAPFGNRNIVLSRGSRVGAATTLARSVGRPDINIINELFSQNEQGLLFDVSDMGRKNVWRRNLLTYTEQFSNAAWQQGGSLVIVANNVIGPRGIQNGTTLSGSSLNRTVSCVAGVTYTFNFWVKAGTSNQAFTGIYDLTNALWPSYTATILQGPGSLSGTQGRSIFSLSTDTWTRVQLTITATTTGSLWLYMYPEGGGSWTGLTNVFAEPQFEIGSTATDYQKLTDFNTEFRGAFPTHALYQDSNGITPCTAPGDPVGLILDKRSLTVPNVELLSTGSIGIIGTATPATYNTSTGQATVSRTDVANQSYIVYPTTTYIRYRISVTNTSASNTLWIRDGGSGGSLIQAVSAGQTVNCLIQATTGTLHFASSSGDVSYTLISLTELAGNHAFQATSGSRPTLGRHPANTGGKRNLCSRSEDFLDGSWIKYKATITQDNIVAPDGSTTADKIVANTETNYHSAYQGLTVISGNTYTVSVYVKAAGYDKFVIGEGFNGGFYASYDLATGSVITTAGAFTNKTQTITPAANGFYRCSITFTATSSYSCSINFIGYPVGATVNVYGANYTGDNTSGVYLWGSQFENNTLTNYQKTISTYDVTEVGANDCWYLFFDGSDDFLQTNSIDFSTATLGARRNILTNTEDFEANNWFKNVAAVSSVNTNASTSPIGDTTADRINWINQSDSDLGVATNNTTAAVANTTMTFSIYVKGEGADVGKTLIMKLKRYTGTLYFEQKTVTLTSGWVRESITLNIGSGATGWTISLSSGTTGALTTLIWGAQLEFGSITDYQKVGTDEMTVFAGIRKVSDSAIGMICELSTDSNANPNAFYLRGPGVVGDNYYWATGGTSFNQIGVSGYSAPITNMLTGQGDISNSTCSLRINGTSAVSNGSSQGTGVFGNYAIYLGRRGGTGLPFSGHIYSLIVRGRTTNVNIIAFIEKYLARNTGLIL